MRSVKAIKTESYTTRKQRPVVTLMRSQKTKGCGAFGNLGAMVSAADLGPFLFTEAHPLFVRNPF